MQLTKESKTQGETTSRIKEWEGTDMILNLNFSKNVNIIHLLIQKIFTEHLLCAGYYFSHQRSGREQKGQKLNSFLNGIYI